MACVGPSSKPPGETALDQVCVGRTSQVSTTPVTALRHCLSSYSSPLHESDTVYQQDTDLAGYLPQHVGNGQQTVALHQKCVRHRPNCFTVVRSEETD